MKNFSFKKIFGLIMLLLVMSPFALMSSKVHEASSFTSLSYSVGQNEFNGDFVGYSNSLDFDEIHEVTRIPSLNSGEVDEPSLTFLVHGLDGNASHWSNKSKTIYINEKESENFELEYDYNSLVSKLKNHSFHANVYHAISKTNSSTINNKKYGFTLKQLIGSDYKPSSTLREFNNVSKHSIILFESSNPNSSHKNVYEELHTIVDAISYDVFFQTGRIPRVNLIGHSRGGITSMMYATGYEETINIVDEDGNISTKNGITNDHPNNVDGLYTIGTPFNGTEIGSWAAEKSNNFDPNNLFNTEGFKDIIDITKQTELRKNWENAVKVNPLLKLNAFATNITKEFLLGIAMEDSFSSIIIDKFNPITIGETVISSSLRSQTKEIFNGIIYWKPLIIAAGIGTEVWLPSILFPHIKWPLYIINSIQFIPAINDIYDDFEKMQKILTVDYWTITELQEFIKSFYSVLCKLEKYTNNNVLGLSILYEELKPKMHEFIGDFAVNTGSQIGEGYKNVNSSLKTYKYVNPKFVDGKFTYDTKNFDFDNRAFKNIGIPHNLQTYDSDIHKQILEDIKLAKPKSIYRYDISNYEVTINGYDLPSYFNENFSKKLSLKIPSHIDGYEVRYIADNAFEGLDEIKGISLPETIIRIGDYAFKDCVNLSNVFELPQSLQSIGEGAFNNCINITSFKIGENNKTNDFEVIDGVLYAVNFMVNSTSSLNNKTGLILMIYPAGKKDEVFQLPDNVIGINDNAFHDNEYLTHIHLNDVEYIGKDVFNFENNIVLVTGENVKLIMDDAITRTKWFKNTSSDLVTLGQSLIRYRGNDDELNISNYYCIVDNAFYGNNVKNVYVDDKIKYIGKDSFTNSSLKKIRILSEVDKVEIGINAFGNSKNLSVQVIGNNDLHTFINNWSIYSDLISPIRTILDLNLNNGDLPTQKTIHYGEFIFLNPPSKDKEGYSFGGWYIDDVLVKNWDLWYSLEENIEVIAKWTPRQFDISFYSINNIISAVNATYGEALPELTLPPRRTGYSFEGYFTEHNGDGIQFYDKNLQRTQMKYEFAKEIILYAKWKNNQYTINYIDGKQVWILQATFDMPLPEISNMISTAKTGHILEGLYTRQNGQGTKLYDSTDPALPYYTFDNDITLYVHWVVETFEIIVSNNGEQFWFQADNGNLNLTSIFGTYIEYGTEFNQRINDLLINWYNTYWPTQGYIITGFHIKDSGNEENIDWNYFIPDLGENHKTLELVPNKNKIVYEITLFDEYLIYGKPNPLSKVPTSSKINVEYIQSNYNVDIPVWDGFIFDGYWTTSQGSGKKIVDIKGQVIDWSIDKNVILYSRWIAKNYIIHLHQSDNVFDKYYSSSGRGTPLIGWASKPGYYLEGYYWTHDDKKIKIYDGNYISVLQKVEYHTMDVNNEGIVRWYAVWRPISYSIKYDLNDGDENQTLNLPISYTIEDKNINLNDFNKPKKYGYDFVYWMLDGTGQTIIDVTIATDIELKAKWYADEVGAGLVEGETRIFTEKTTYVSLPAKNNFIFYIANSVQKITFASERFYVHRNIEIIVLWRDTSIINQSKLHINFNNVNMVAKSNKELISTRNAIHLYLENKGSSILRGGEVNSGASQVGKSAISNLEGSVYIGGLFNYSFIFEGTNGTNGLNGRDGNIGANGHDPSSTGHGGHGSNGTDGARGNNGGNGGRPISSGLIELFIGNGTIKLSSGHGGNGGHGGWGGQGGRGGHGNGGSFWSSRNGGNGGLGGKGGNGGDGGLGGLITSPWNNNSPLHPYTIISVGQQGEGGIGGRGGDGGYGGANGPSPFSKGSHGNGGAGGRGGLGGQGRYYNAYYQVSGNTGGYYYR